MLAPTLQLNPPTQVSYLHPKTSPTDPLNEKANKVDLQISAKGLNARSIRSPLKRRIFELALEQGVYDVIFVCETWLKERIRDPSRKYNLFQTNAADGYGGTMIAVKNVY